MLDFEATCDDRPGSWDPALQELIELPVALVSVGAGRVVDTFRSLVRPIHQPELTPFCTRLTSIRQDQLAGQPTVLELMPRFEAWLSQHRLHPENCCVVTCGDWDLRSMWPRQVGLTPGLTTPPLFRRWANLKTLFALHHGGRPMGMMGMLRRAGLEHRGHHHLGIDDVHNLARIVLYLLERGAMVVPTFSDEAREAERARLDEKRSTLAARLAAARAARDHRSADAGVVQGIVDLETQLERLDRRRAVFAGA